ncbi:MAG: hypothetical protein HS099_00570 [Ardenticatenaceae bacterium]|nr:hypothetical protein [Ardenticatenaceae bacterium]
MNEVFEWGLSEKQILEEILQEMGYGEQWVYRKPASMCGDGNGNYECGKEDTYRPCREWEDCYDPMFDTFSASGSVGSVVGINVTFTADKFGNVYGTFGLQLGTPGLSGSVVAGNTIGKNARPVEDLSEEVLEGSLTGSGQAIGGGAIVGGSISGSGQPQPSQLQVGIFSPQFYYTFFSTTGLIYDAGDPTPWFWQEDDEPEE